MHVIFIIRDKYIYPKIIRLLSIRTTAILKFNQLQRFVTYFTLRILTNCRTFAILRLVVSK